MRCTFHAQGAYVVYCAVLLGAVRDGSSLQPIANPAFAQGKTHLPHTNAHSTCLLPCISACVCHTCSLRRLTRSCVVKNTFSLLTLLLAVCMFYVFTPSSTDTPVFVCLCLHLLIPSIRHIYTISYPAITYHAYVTPYIFDTMHM